MRVYLAGPITGKTYEDATDWREYAKKELSPYGVIGVDPMRSKDYLLGETTLRDATSESSWVLSSQKGIVARDRFDVRTADVLIVNLLDADRVSIGTMVELGWADAYRVPIILVMGSGNEHDHAFVREVAGFIVSTVDEAIAVAVAIGRGR